MLNQENYKNSAYFRRRSIRTFSERKVEEWKVKALIEGFFQTQSAKNQMGGEIIYIDDRELILKLRKLHYFGRSLETAPLVFIVTSVENYNEVLKMPIRIQQDLGAATHQICLMACDLGLGSVWCGMHPVTELEEPIKELLNIPSSVMGFSLIAVGYGTEVKEPNDKYFQNKVHHNGW
jgi:nitroreductase